MIRRLLLTATLLATVCPESFAQPSVPGTSVGHPLLNARQHKLQPGDQVEIYLFSLPELPKAYQVRADGRFHHPVIGEVKAAGMTLGNLEEQLRALFKKQLRDPSFSIGLVSVSQMDIAALGEVAKTGKYNVSTGTSLLDLLAQIGGITPKADPEGAFIIRDGKQITVSVSQANQPDLAKFILRAGDIFFVNAGRRVSVSGEVREPGIYAVSPKSNRQFEDCIKAAGGTKETAAVSRIVLVRPTLAQPIIIDLLEKNPNPPWPELQDGDTVMVQPRTAVVLGAVSKVGPMPLEGNENLMDILSKAGSNQGKLEEIVVIRAHDVRSGTDKREIYNIEKYLKEATPMPPVPISDGDLVYVPPKEQSQGLLGGGGLLGLLMLARSFTSF